MSRSHWLLYVAFGIGLAIASPALSQTDSDGEIEGQAEAQKSQTEPAKEDSKEAPPVRADPSTAERETGPDPAAEQNDNSTPDEDQPLPEWKAFLTDLRAQWTMAISGIFAVAFSFVAVILLKLTLDATNKAVNESRAASAAARKAADAATAGNDLAAQTLDGMQTNAQRQLRSYLQVENVKMVQIGAPFGKVIHAAQITVRNTGQTPARRVYKSLNVVTFDAGDLEREIQLQEATPRPIRSIGTGQVVEDQIICEGVTSDGGPQLGKVIFVYGTYTYLDVFGDEWRTPFRWANVYNEFAPTDTHDEAT